MKKFVRFIVVGAGLVIAAWQLAIAGDSRVCVVANVESPFRLPNGSLYPAGTLKMCDGGSYSPIHNFQRILVNGRTVGMFVSLRRLAELRSSGPAQVLFNRASDGNLSLIGYVLPSLGQSVAFRIKPQPAPSRSSDVASAVSDTTRPPTIASAVNTR